MILLPSIVGDEMTLNGWLCSTPATVIVLPEQEDLVCSCDFVSYSCDYEELAFAYPLDELDTYRNDFRRILITLLDDSSSYEFFLVGSDNVETPLVDGTYGTLFDLGFNASQPLKAGYEIEWLKVFNLLGGGIYTIKIIQTDLGTPITVESHNFRLMLFSELASQGTVKIKTNQKGVNLRGDDFTGMEWVKMNRIHAEFGNESQQNEILRLKDGNYKDFDVQNEYFYQYTLSTDLLPSTIADSILNSDTKTDEIFISNYDVFAYRQYRDLEVVAEGSVEPSDDYKVNKNKKFNITFEDSNKNLKRNFN